MLVMDQLGRLGTTEFVKVSTVKSGEVDRVPILFWTLLAKDHYT